MAGAPEPASGDRLGREAQRDAVGAGLVHHEAERLAGLQGQVARRGDEAAREGELDHAGLHRDDPGGERLAGGDREDLAGVTAIAGAPVTAAAAPVAVAAATGAVAGGTGTARGCDGRHPTHRRPRGARPEAPGDQVASRGCR